jgi:hypothetical protein
MPNTGFFDYQKLSYTKDWNLILPKIGFFNYTLVCKKKKNYNSEK